MDTLPYPIPVKNTTANATATGGQGKVVARLGAERIPVVVQEGPAWLGGFLYAPPPWIGAAIKVIVLLIALGVVAGYLRHGVDENVLEEMAFAVFVVVGVLGLAEVVRSGVVPGPYVARMLVAGVGGWALAHGFVRGVDRGVCWVNNQ